MSGGFFQSTMRNAAMILFVIAIAALIVAVIPVFTALSAGDTSSPFASDPSHLAALSALVSVASAIHNAAWPFFGAAVLWRWDRFVDMKAGAAQ